MTRQLLGIFEADGEHKATLRERLKGQDDALGKLLDLTRGLERRLDSPRAPGGSGS